jgi:hypothetical protein
VELAQLMVKPMELSERIQYFHLLLQQVVVLVELDKMEVLHQAATADQVEALALEILLTPMPVLPHLLEKETTAESLTDQI